MTRARVEPAPVVDNLERKLVDARREANVSASCMGVLATFCSEDAAGNSECHGETPQHNARRDATRDD